MMQSVPGASGIAILLTVVAMLVGALIWLGVLVGLTLQYFRLAPDDRADVPHWFLAVGVLNLVGLLGLWPVNLVAFLPSLVAGGWYAMRGPDASKHLGVWLTASNVVFAALFVCVPLPLTVSILAAY